MPRMEWYQLRLAACLIGIAASHTVADTLRNLGLAQERMLIMGVGPDQPVAPSASEEDRRKNRRVEIFVMGPDVPVIGWTDSTPSLYGNVAE